MNHCIKHPELAEEGQQILNRTILNMPFWILSVSDSRISVLLRDLPSLCANI